MRDDLIAKARDERVSAILVAGDLTSTGEPAEFAECGATISGVADAIGVDARNVFTCFGNHDVNWAIARLGERSNDTLYSHVASSVGELFARNKEPNEVGPCFGTGVYRRDGFVVFVLNSGTFCDHDQAYPHGRLGQEQLKWITEAFARCDDTSDWRIVMVHHHPRNYPYPVPMADISAIEEGAEFLQVVGRNRVDVVVHGHRHHPIMQTVMESSWSSPVTFVCSGSLSVNAIHRSAGEIPNAFHILSLERRSDAEAALGVLKSFRYTSSRGWIPSEHSDAFPLDPVQRFGQLATEAQRRNMAAQVVERSIASSGGKLPTHQDLPGELQCVSSAELNALIAGAAKELQHRPIGSYPDAVAVFREDA